MAASSTKRLTEGKPLSLILGFSLPLLTGMLFQQFYGLVDTIIVGKCLGTDALAAVGSTGSINFLINGFCMGVCSGFAIPVAQRFGAKSYDSMRKYVSNGIILSIIFAAVMTIIVSWQCRTILEVMNTPANIIDGAYSYIFIIFLGIPVTYLYNLTAGVMRSLGDSKTPVYFLLLASAINIALDFTFILLFGMGVEGPAYATVISQFIAGMGCLIYMVKKFTILKMQPGDWKLGKHHVSVLCSMGIPMGLQYSITAIGSVILQTAVNGLGSAAVAAMTAGSRLSMFIVCPFDALGSTMATYCGQNVGAKKIDRAREGIKVATILGAIYSVIAFVAIWLVGRFMLLLFLDATDVQIIGDARMFLLFNAGAYFLLACVNIYRFAIQGCGFSSFAIIAGVLEMIARILAAWVLIPILGFKGACLASPIAWVMADAFLVPGFFYVCRKLDVRLNSEHRI